MDEARRRVTVRVKLGDVEQAFEGDAESVWLGLNKFFGELVPSFDVAKRLVLSVDLQKLANDCESLIGLSPEGANVLVPKGKLTDNEVLGLLLLASHVGFRLGRLQNDCISRDELAAKLGKDSKIVSTRLGELVKGEIAAKTADDKYRMTTFGVIQMQKEILPKIKSKVC